MIELVDPNDAPAFERLITSLSRRPPDSSF